MIVRRKIQGQNHLRKLSKCGDKCLWMLAKLIYIFFSKFSWKEKYIIPIWPWSTDIMCNEQQKQVKYSTLKRIGRLPHTATVLGDAVGAAQEGQQCWGLASLWVPCECPAPGWVKHCCHSLLLNCRKGGRKRRKGKRENSSLFYISNKSFFTVMTIEKL